MTQLPEFDPSIPCPDHPEAGVSEMAWGIETLTYCNLCQCIVSRSFGIIVNERRVPERSDKR